MLGVDCGQSVKGWADSRSVWILDFWREMSIVEKRYVLVHEDPRQLLSRLIACSSNLNIEAVLVEWMAHERELLRFAYSHRGECVLVDGTQALANPQGFLGACAERLGIDLDVVLAISGDTPQSTSHLSDILAGQVIALYPEVEALSAEIESSLTWGDALTRVRAVATERVSLFNAIDELQGERLAARQLRDQRQDALMELNRLPSQLEQLEEEMLGIEQHWKNQYQTWKEDTERLRSESNAQAVEQSDDLAAYSDPISSQTREIQLSSRNLSHLKGERDGLINEIRSASSPERRVERACLNSFDLGDTGSDVVQLYDQLLQVQAELEACYLANQSLRLDLRTEALQSARWRRLMEAHPDYAVLVQAYKLIGV